jgi:hypothetical protein
MHIDTLRGSIGNADDVIKYLAVDDLRLDGAGEAETRSSRRTGVELLDVVIRASEVRSWCGRDGLSCGRLSPRGQKTNITINPVWKTPWQELCLA